jgi:hypothetical protein
VQEQVGARGVGVQRGQQSHEPRTQARAQRHLRVQPLELCADQRARVARAVAVEQRADLAEREAEAAERDDPVQAPDVLVGVQAIARLAAPRRRQQADLVVVMQRADRQARGRRHLADAPQGRHGARLGPHVT